MEILDITVNGTEYKVLVEPHDTLSKVIREKINLTGTKLGCEQASCGACTILVDGKPVQSCVTPALRFQGSNVTTIEGVADKGNLHKLQEKFVEKGAIQCGYCTPGMVMTSLAYLKENPNPTSSRDSSISVKAFKGSYSTFIRLQACSANSSVSAATAATISPT